MEVMAVMKIENKTGRTVTIGGVTVGPYETIEVGKPKRGRPKKDK